LPDSRTVDDGVVLELEPLYPPVWALARLAVAARAAMARRFNFMVVLSAGNVALRNRASGVPATERSAGRTCPSAPPGRDPWSLFRLKSD
jgi:hypothetical protein